MTHTTRKGETMLSDIQKEALRKMDERNFGAYWLPNRGYVFPVHIRNDEEAAREVLEEMLRHQMRI